MIALLHDNGCFYLIRSLPAYIGTTYYCLHCDHKSSSRETHYNCPLLCRKCSQENCHGPEYQLCCLLCKIVFKTQKCFDNHKLKGKLIKHLWDLLSISGSRHGKSRCESTSFCEKCQMSYYTNKKNKKEAHMCGLKFCKTCGVPREKDHVCYLAVRPPPKKRDLLKRIYFDIEVSLFL